MKKFERSVDGLSWEMTLKRWGRSVEDTRLDVAQAFGFRHSEAGWGQYLDTIEKEGRKILSRLRATR